MNQDDSNEMQQSIAGGCFLPPDKDPEDPGYISVGKLIELLQEFDPSLPVVTNGFDECGIDYISAPTPMRILLNAHKPGHTGGHEDIADMDEEDLKDYADGGISTIIDAVHISF